ncbi:MAG TPA: MerR family DNA-binding transcriptional regulator [Acidimicrobiia bacterium]
MDRTMRGQRSTDEVLSSSEAAMFRVEAKTVARWARAGLIGCIRTSWGRRSSVLEAARNEAGGDNRQLN